MNQTEIVGPLAKTTHNLQDVACLRKTRRSWYEDEGLYGCEHHGRIS